MNEFPLNSNIVVKFNIKPLTKVRLSPHSTNSINIEFSQTYISDGLDFSVNTNPKVELQLSPNINLQNSQKFNEGDFLMVKILDGEKVFVGVTIDEIATLMGFDVLKPNPMTNVSGLPDIDVNEYNVDISFGEDSPLEAFEKVINDKIDSISSVSIYNNINNFIHLITQQSNVDVKTLIDIDVDLLPFNIGLT